MNKSRRQYLKKIQEKFDYKFTNQDILNEAIDRTELSDSYEFFGDIALYGAASDFMIHRYTQNTRYNFTSDFTKCGIESLNVKKLNEIKSKLTSNITFGSIIKKLDLVDGMPLTIEDERNEVRTNMHRLGDLYERIIGAIAIDSNYYQGAVNLSHITKIFTKHIELVIKQLDLPEYLEDDLGYQNFARENTLKKDDLYSNKVDDITILKLLVDKNKIPMLTYEFSMKRNQDNSILHCCTAKFPKDSTVGLKSFIESDLCEPYEDIYQWDSYLFNSIGYAKTKNEAKATVAHKVLNKLRVRYGVTFIEHDFPDERRIEYKIESRFSKLTKNIEVSDEVIKKLV